MAISSSAPLSPVAIVKASWGSFKQNAGTFVLTALTMVGLYLGTILAGSFLVMMARTTGRLGLVLMVIVVLGLFFVMVGYLALMMTRLAYLGSAGAHVPLREVLAWDKNVVLRMTGVSIALMAIFWVATMFGVLVIGAPLIMQVLGGQTSMAAMASGAIFLAVGYVVLLVLMLLLEATFSQSMFLALQGSGVWAAVRGSVALTRGSRWRIVGTFVLLGLLVLICYLPTLFAILLTAVGIADPGLLMVINLIGVLGLVLVMIGGFVAGGMSIFAQGHLFRALSTRK